MNADEKAAAMAATRLLEARQLESDLSKLTEEETRGAEEHIKTVMRRGIDKMVATS